MAKTKNQAEIVQTVGMLRCDAGNNPTKRHQSGYMGSHTFSNGVRAGVFVTDETSVRFNSETATTVPINGKGTKGLGYVQWGYLNKLPNIIARAAKRSPYIAPVIKFNAETMYARGPKPKYRYAHLHNGHVNVETVDYEFAGVFIKEQLRQARLKSKAKDTDGNPLYDEQDIRNEIETLNADYRTWQRTQTEVQQFIENNDLQDFTMQSCLDMQYYNLFFPEVGLSIGRAEGSEWEPRIVELRPLKCVHTRLEERDKQGVINYVYYSKHWGEDDTASGYQTADRVTAIPALDIRQAGRQLRNLTRNKSFSERVFRYVIPILYASVDKEYYPEPAWYSIFRSTIANYAERLIADKNTVKNNDNSWGKIVYVSGIYLQQLYADAGAMNDQEKKKEVEDKLYNEINEFLSSDENAGKPLLAYTLQGPNGEQIEAIKIVNAPTALSGSETKDELEEIASIMYAAQDMHPSMNGAVPGKNSQSGGTQIRELLGTKNVRLEPMRDYVLKVFRFISEFNNWDKHLVWEMPYSVLTTLDRNKTGIEENQE